MGQSHCNETSGYRMPPNLNETAHIWNSCDACIPRASVLSDLGRDEVRYNRRDGISAADLCLDDIRESHAMQLEKVTAFVTRPRTTGTELLLFRHPTRESSSRPAPSI